MKATGIVRKIDELGRIVIPKEIRKNLMIREGDPLEIYLEENSEIVLKKYATLKNVAAIADEYTEILSKKTGYGICICDMERIIAVEGIAKTSYLNMKINKDVLNIILDRILYSTIINKPKKILIDDKTIYFSQIISPIICDGETVGAVILLSTDYSKKITEVEVKMTSLVTDILAKQMEIK